MESTAPRTLPLPEADLPPICVDLDGTLVRGDLFHEGLAALLRSPTAWPDLLRALARGKAAVKRHVAETTPLDATTLPYDGRLLEWLRRRRAAGRRLVLATAADETHAAAVAGHLGLFERVVASDGVRNLRGAAKRDALVERFGAFEYAGDSRADVPVWRAASRRIVVNASPATRRRLAPVADDLHFEPSATRWWRALRPHQWAKNALVAVPLVTSLRVLDPAAVAGTVWLTAAFCLACSGNYLVNDLLDLPADRRHPGKRYRPLAAGDLSIPTACGLIALCLGGGLLMAALHSALAAAAVAGYLLYAAAYSAHLKRLAVVDVFALSGCYVWRLGLGCIAAACAPSAWLLLFAFCTFLALALMKRCTEIAAAGDVIALRGYQPADLDVLRPLGVACSVASVVVLGLYVTDDFAHTLWRHPQVLWALVPLTLFWHCRAWLLTGRGQMHDDPVVFALRDRVSRLVALAAMAAAALAVALAAFTEGATG